MVVWRFWRRSLAIAAVAAISVLVACGPAAPSYPIISLERTICLGSCPAYTVTIDGKGVVTFSTDTPAISEASALSRRLDYGKPAVLLPGRHTDRISQDAVEALAKRFEDIGFFSLQDKYVGGGTDFPTFEVTIDTGDRRKKVTDYMGWDVGMPGNVSELENEIDRVAGTARWLDGANGLVAWLSAQGFDFKSNVAASLLANGSSDYVKADEQTLVGLVERGAPLDLVIAGGQSYLAGQPVGAEAMWYAIAIGRRDLFVALKTRGWLEKLGLDKAADAFARGVGGCDPDFADLLKASGIDVDAAAKLQPGQDYPYTSTALSTLNGTAICADSAKRVAMAERLIALGADPNKRDADGRTPVFAVYDPVLLDFLLAHGADATVKDNKGNSAALSWTEDDVVVRLLEAGADPNGKSDDGKTLAELVKDGKMPATAKWLKQHKGRIAPPR